MRGAIECVSQVQFTTIPYQQHQHAPASLTMSHNPYKISPRFLGSIRMFTVWQFSCQQRFSALVSRIHDACLM